MIEHPDTDRPPRRCEICEDERQYVPAGGQRWTTQTELAAEGHRCEVTELEENLYAVTACPNVGIGQRGLLVRTGSGNLLWEPPGFLDQDAVDQVRALGGIAAISASHPHLVGASIQWSHAFGQIPVLVHEADQRWIRRPDPVIRLWPTTHELLPGLTLAHCGGHFRGSALAHWAAGAERKGALLTGDTIGVGADRKSVNAMRSYVNNIPLPEVAIRRIMAAVDPYRFDRMYDAWGTLDGAAKPAVEFSLQRYINWIRGDVDDF